LVIEKIEKTARGGGHEEREREREREREERVAFLVSGLVIIRTTTRV
jgi:hypothetical protein